MRTKRFYYGNRSDMRLGAIEIGKVRIAHPTDLNSTSRNLDITSPAFNRKVEFFKQKNLIIDTSYEELYEQTLFYLSFHHPDLLPRF